MGMLSVVKREVRHVGGIALYLFLSFGIFTTLKNWFWPVIRSSSQPSCRR